LPDAPARNAETLRDCAARAAASFDVRSSAQSTRGWVPRSSPSLLRLYLWSFHLEPIRRSRVGWASHAANRHQFIRIDFEVIEKHIVHVESHHLAEHNAPTERFPAHLHNLKQPAFHLDVRFLHAWRLYADTRQRRQSGQFELIHFRRILARTHVHAVGE